MAEQQTQEQAADMRGFAIRGFYDVLIREAQHAHSGYATNVKLLSSESDPAAASDAYQYAAMHAAAVQGCQSFAGQAQAYETAARRLAQHFPSLLSGALNRLYVDVRRPPVRGGNGNAGVGLKVPADTVADGKGPVVAPPDRVAAGSSNRDPAAVSLGDDAVHASMMPARSAAPKLDAASEQALYSLREMANEFFDDRRKLLFACASTLEQAIKRVAR